MQIKATKSGTFANIGNTKKKNKMLEIPRNTEHTHSCGNRKCYRLLKVFLLKMVQIHQPNKEKSSAFITYLNESVTVMDNYMIQIDCFTRYPY